jgi:hypothetical protein
MPKLDKKVYPYTKKGEAAYEKAKKQKAKGKGKGGKR